MKTLTEILAVTIKETLTALNCESNAHVVNLYLEELDQICELNNEYSLTDAINNCYEEAVLLKCLDIINDND